MPFIISSKRRLSAAGKEMQSQIARSYNVRRGMISTLAYSFLSRRR